MRVTGGGVAPGLRAGRGGGRLHARRSATSCSSPAASPSSSWNPTGLPAGRAEPSAPRTSRASRRSRARAETAAITPTLVRLGRGADRRPAARCPPRPRATWRSSSAGRPSAGRTSAPTDRSACWPSRSRARASRPALRLPGHGRQRDGDGVAGRWHAGWTRSAAPSRSSAPGGRGADRPRRRRPRRCRRDLRRRRGLAVDGLVLWDAPRGPHVAAQAPGVPAAGRASSAGRPRRSRRPGRRATGAAGFLLRLAAAGRPRRRWIWPTSRRRLARPRAGTRRLVLGRGTAGSRRSRARWACVASRRPSRRQHYEGMLDEPHRAAPGRPASIGSAAGWWRCPSPQGQPGRSPAERPASPAAGVLETAFLDSDPASQLFGVECRPATRTAEGPRRSSSTPRPCATSARTGCGCASPAARRRGHRLAARRRRGVGEAGATRPRRQHRRYYDPILWSDVERPPSTRDRAAPAAS